MSKDEIILSGLTEEQRDAVKIIDRNLEIIACAGAGKTRTITRRIIYLIANGVKPENIVAITYTRKAAEELRSRIFAAGQELLGNTIGFAGMFIGTIDSFCFKMLQEYVPEYAKFSMLDEVQIKIFMEHFSTKGKNGTGDPTGLKGSLIDNATNLKNQASRKANIYVNLMTMLNTNYYNREYRDSWSEDLKNCLKSYNDCLKRNKYFDFSSLIREMIEYLDPDSDTNGGRISDFANKVFERVKYLTIDEYQDTNPSQEYLAELFDRYGNTNICVVGDADQTIYQFRGSDESNILEFVDRFHAEKVQLDTDFRSTKAIVDIANKAILKNHAEDANHKLMKCGKVPESSLEYEKGDATYKCFDNFEQESNFIINQIKQLKENGIPLSEIAILLRKRVHYGIEVVDFQEKFSGKLKEAGIACIVKDLNTLWTTPEYKASCELFKFIDDNYFFKNSNVSSKNNVKSGLTTDSLQIGKFRLKNAWLEIERFYNATGLAEGIDDAIEDIVSKDWQNIKYGNDFNMQQIFQDFICHMAFIDSEDSAAETVLYNLGKFSKVIADFELLFFKDFAQYKSARFVGHLKYVAEGLYPEGEDDNKYIKTDAVNIMTIHASKGLEFTAVFIPGMVQSIVPGKNKSAIPDKKSSGGKKITDAISALEKYAEQDNKQANEWLPNYEGYQGSEEAERKLFYVAVTRAKKYLFFTHSNWYDTGENVDNRQNNKNEIKSDFLTDVERSGYLTQYDDSIQYSCDRLPLIEKHKIPIVLNFSLLSNYFDCPYRFKLSCFYGFVQPYVTEMGYGKMLHEIMMHIHKAWIAGEELTREQVDRIVNGALYLPFASEPELRRALQGAKSNAWSYVEQNKRDADKMIASEIDINIEMGDGISVNGRIDLIRKIENDEKDKIAIVDLKSAGKDAEQCLNAEQLKIYELGYEEMTGEPADYLMIYNLDFPDGSKNAMEKIQKKEIEVVRGKIMKAANDIRSSQLPRCEGSKCDTCHLKKLCMRNGEKSQ
ncbi:MAG: ATP-dependent helicase [Lachnospiraceae bacterium]|nr:ATP-dependent helicase [Lachnospiraceae bacterium]